MTTTTVLLDNQVLSLDRLGPEATIADLLTLAKERLTGTGSVLVGLRRREEEVTGDELERMLSQPLAGYDSLKLISDRPGRIVQDALTQVRSAFSETFAEVQEAAAALAAGKVSEAMQILGACAEVWGKTHTSVIQAGLLVHVDFEHLSIGGHPMAHWLNELANRLRDLKTAVESRDLVMLGDILRYELDDTLQQWERMLDGFIAHVEQLDH